MKKESDSQLQQYIRDVEFSIEANEMFSRPSTWVMNWGTLSIVIVFTLMFGISIGIKYPDTIGGDAVITTNPLPIRIKSFAQGRLSSIYISNGEFIRKDEPIVEIENNTGFYLINKIQMTIDTVLFMLDNRDIRGLEQLVSAPLVSLGEAQTPYNILVQNVNNYLLLVNEHIYSRREANLNEQIENHNAVSQIGNNEKQLIDNDLNDFLERFSANEKLYKDKIISKMEYQQEIANLRQKQLALQGQLRSSVQNKIVIGENRKQLFEMRYDQAEKELSVRIAIEESLRNLQNYIGSWKRNYLLVAPFDGKLHYLKMLQQNQSITSGEELFAVVPEDYEYVALVSLPAEGFGKVELGQKVQLMTDKYPYQEYGYLQGTIVSLAELPQQESNPSGKNVPGIYRVIVELDKSLLTSYKKTIQFTPEMTCKANVISSNRTLFDRLISRAIRMN